MPVNSSELVGFSCTDATSDVGSTVATVTTNGGTMDDQSDDTGGLDDEEVVFHVPVEMQAGVWANWARISESDHAFGESAPV